MFNDPCKLSFLTLIEFECLDNLSQCLHLIVNCLSCRVSEWLPYNLKKQVNKCQHFVEFRTRILAVIVQRVYRKNVILEHFVKCPYCFFSTLLETSRYHIHLSLKTLLGHDRLNHWIRNWWLLLSSVLIWTNVLLSWTGTRLLFSCNPRVRIRAKIVGRDRSWFDIFEWWVLFSLH